MDISKLRSDRVGDAKVSDSKGTGAGAKAKSVQAGEASAAERVPNQSIENVKLSEESSLLADGIQHAKNSPDTRSEKVAALKAAIRNGSYKIDSRGIADKMIQSSLEDDLLSRKS